MYARTMLKVAIAAVVLAGLWLGASYAWNQGRYITLRQPDGAQGRTPGAQQYATERVPREQVAATIAMTPEAYIPDTVTIPAGTAVAFRNDGVSSQWPVSDLHPDHTLEPRLNADGVVRPGGTWYATLTRPGTYWVHDEVYPNLRAAIVVE